MASSRLAIIVSSLALAASAFAGDVLNSASSKATQLDVNGDGRIDTWRAFDSLGHLVSAWYDLNFDGKPDEEVTYSPKEIVRKTSTKKNGVFDLEIRRQLAPNGNVLSERVTRIKDGVSTLVSESVFDHKKGEATTTTFRFGHKQVSTQPLAVNSTYIDDYTDCLFANKKDALQCFDSVSFGVQAGTALVFASKVTPLACESKDKLFTGTGALVDKKSCKDPQMIVSTFKRAIEKLDSCFNPATGKYPHMPLHHALIDTYSEAIHSGGIEFKCAGPHVQRAADANAYTSPMTIQIYDGSLTQMKNEPWAGESTLGHEFMHLSQSLGFFRKIDNQTVEDHNAVENMFEDRIFACEHLCFDPKRTSRSTCELCMNYPMPGVSRVPYHQACKGFVEFSPVEEKFRTERAKIEAARNDCDKKAGDFSTNPVNFAAIDCVYRFRTQQAELLARMEKMYLGNADYQKKFPKDFRDTRADRSLNERLAYESAVAYYCAAQSAKSPKFSQTIYASALTTVTGMVALPKTERDRLKLKFDTFKNICETYEYSGVDLPL